MNAQLSQAPKRINPTSGQTGRAENQKHYAANYSTSPDKYDVAPEHYGLFNAVDTSKSEIEHLRESIIRYTKTQVTCMKLAEQYRNDAAATIERAEAWERGGKELSELLHLAYTRLWVLEGNDNV